MKTHWTDIQELAVVVLGLPEDCDIDEVEQKLWQRYEISFESFHKIVDDLIPFTVPAASSLSGTQYHGFVKNGAFIVKAKQE